VPFGTCARIVHGCTSERQYSRFLDGLGITDPGRLIFLQAVGSRRALRVGRALMVLQVAVSTVLLASSALFIRSLIRLQSVDLGFARAGVLTMDVTPERSWFGRPEWVVTQSTILEHVRSLPGVEAVSWSTMTPLNGRDRGSGIQVPGFVPQGPRDDEVHLVSTSPDYFATFGISVLSGRAFTSRDDAGAAKVAVLNRLPLACPRSSRSDAWFEVFCTA
jgi:putative ABC transport system permease protein